MESVQSKEKKRLRKPTGRANLPEQSFDRITETNIRRKTHYEQLRSTNHRDGIAGNEITATCPKKRQCKEIAKANE